MNQVNKLMFFVYTISCRAVTTSFLFYDWSSKLLLCQSKVIHRKKVAYCLITINNFEKGW